MNILLRVAAVLAITGLGAIAQETTTIKSRKMVVGDKVQLAKTNKLTQTVSIKVQGQAQPEQKMDVSDKFVFEVVALAVNDNGITKGKVTVKEASQTGKGPQGPGMDDIDPSVLTGNTYIVEIKNGEFFATDEQGVEIDESTKGILKAMLEDKDDVIFSPGDKVSNVVIDQPLTIGQVINLNDEQLKALTEKLPIASATFTFKGKKMFLGIEVAIFDMLVRVDGDPNEGQEQAGGLDMNLAGDMKGEALIGIATGWSHSMKVKGDLKIKGSNENVELNGDMTIDVGGMAIYSPKK